MSTQDNSLLNEAVRLEAENRELRAKLEAAEREIKSVKWEQNLFYEQIIELTQMLYVDADGMRDIPRSLNADVELIREMRTERDQLREQRDALAAALEKERDRFDALRGFCESEIGWEYFRAEFMLGEKVSASQRNAEKLHKYLEANPRPAIDPAAIRAEHDREVRRKAIREARMKVEVLASELNRMAEEQA